MYRISISIFLYSISISIFLYSVFIDVNYVHKSNITYIIKQYNLYMAVFRKGNGSKILLDPILGCPYFKGQGLIFWDPVNSSESSCKSKK